MREEYRSCVRWWDWWTPLGWGLKGDIASGREMLYIRERLDRDQERRGVVLCIYLERIL